MRWCWSMRQMANGIIEIISKAMSKVVKTFRSRLRLCVGRMMRVASEEDMKLYGSSCIRVLEPGGEAVVEDKDLALPSENERARTVATISFINTLCPGSCLG